MRAMRRCPTLNVQRSNPPAATRGLALFAKLVVLLTFALIFVGGHTTTAGAGMAFPDWPLSSGSVNPDGWWENLMQRLEHGHRLTAETVGLLIGVLCAWVWRSRWSLPIAAAVSVTVALAARFSGADRQVVAHIGLWGSAITFALIILWRADRGEQARPASVRWLAFAAFLGVLAQAILGGLRVTIESSGDPHTATALRVIHGCVAQIELCLLVALAAVLSPAWMKISANARLTRVSRFGWIVGALIFVQLIVGATMRHLGAGLAIPTFPQAMPDGGWMPKVHNVFVDLNFTHTRVGALVVTVLVVAFAVRVLRNAGGDRLLSGAALMLFVLLAAQLTLGVFVIWQLRPPMLTTLHVVNGAALLATTVLLNLRAGHAAALSVNGGTKLRRAQIAEVAV
jgi:heme a synthase